ncbi:unnamed protein product [Arabidopsis halleri]
MIRLRTLIEKNRSESRRKIDSSSFDSLPEGCISNIISFTSPEDACVAATVSKIFESAVKSDIVWEKFLPADYASLIPPSRVFSSKKELYFSLCDDPLLIDDGKLSIWLEKASGKRCVMYSATAMMNFSSMGDIFQRFEWIPIPEARFETVAQLREACKFKFNCRMNTRVLSPRTRYSVYIVFKKADTCCGFKAVSLEAVVGVVGQDSFRRFICFDTHAKGKFRKGKVVVKPEAREDGWMEVELGEFFNEGGWDSDEIEMTTVERKYAQQNRGLVILGIEIRPTKILEEFSGRCL